jgi:6-phosphogluconolactonase
MTPAAGFKVEVMDTAEAAASEAAAIIAEEAKEAVEARGRFLVAVSGGRTPWAMLRVLATINLPWHAVQIFQVDERVAALDHPDRNLMHLRESLLGYSPLRAAQIHGMPVESSNPSVAAVAYAGTLRLVAGVPPVLDLIHLGLGADGHTASLVPGDPVVDADDTDVAATGVYQGRHRVTLTFPIINRARRVLWVVTGAEKAAALRRLFDGDTAIPAGRVRRESARVVTDIAAAARLPEQNRPPDQTRRSHRRVGIATDHAGFERKDELIAYLHDAGHEVVDVGAYSPNPGDDYPDFVIPLAEAVAAGRVDRGIAVCGSGVGASVCANKVPGIRAGLVDDHFSARQGVEDDNMNILCMSGRAVGPAVAREILDAFLTAEFS